MKSLYKKAIVAILTFEARLVLRRYKPKIVAVTGSVGKTSTKDAVYAVLASTYHARKSEKSFNSELGVPLTILGLPNAWSNVFGWLENMIEGLLLLVRKKKYPSWLVLEVGADRPGDIKALSWIRPHVVVYTRFPDLPVHVEYFPTKESVAEEKRELGRALRAEGTLIINGDDPMMEHETVCDGQRMLSYGFRKGVTVRGGAFSVRYEDERPVGVSCSVETVGQHAELVIMGALGKHLLAPALAALAVAVSEGVPFDRALTALQSCTPAPGRLRILAGEQGSIVLDDTYNASPVAVLAGLEALAYVRTHARVFVVLGDMLELGEYSVQAHREVGERVALVADLFLAVGVRMRAAADAAKAIQGKLKHVQCVKDAYDAASFLKGRVAKNDLVYVKGSQSMRMERVVEALLAEPGTAASVLVRQDPVWKAKK